jgi:hypothetical protein
MELARKMQTKVTMTKAMMSGIHPMGTYRRQISHTISADLFRLGFLVLSKPELLSASNEMHKVDHRSMRFAKHFGLSGNPLPSSSKAVLPRQHHCTTLASFCGTPRHCIRIFRALSAAGSCNAMMSYLDPDDVST